MATTYAYHDHLSRSGRNTLATTAIEYCNAKGRPDLAGDTYSTAIDQTTGHRSKDGQTAHKSGYTPSSVIWQAFHEVLRRERSAADPDTITTDDLSHHAKTDPGHRATSRAELLFALYTWLSESIDSARLLETLEPTLEPTPTPPRPYWHLIAARWTPPTIGRPAPLAAHIARRSAARTAA